MIKVFKYLITSIAFVLCLMWPILLFLYMYKSDIKEIGIVFILLVIISIIFIRKSEKENKISQ